MYQIIDNRSSGKTGRLLRLAKENNGVIVCLDPITMRRKSHGYGIVGLTFMSYYDFLNGEERLSADTPIYIDDLEAFAQYVSYKSNGKLDGYTLSYERTGI
jgi:hypothetical protein